VIITTLGILKSRNGPRSLAEYRRQKMKWTQEAATAMFQIPDTKWEHDLGEAFELVVIDEAHLVKNPDTAAHATVAWLKASFHILVTASVLPSGIPDWEGFQKFIDINRNLWDPTNLARLGVTMACNPYTLPDDHPACELRMTTRAAETYVTNPTVPRALAGFYLGKIWRKCLIRRTYESKDPRDPMGPLISGSLPRLEIRRIECSFSNEEQMFYNLISKEPHARLSHRLENGQVVWNRKYTRQLLLYCNWLKFFYISNSMMATSVPAWKASQNSGLFRSMQSPTQRTSAWMSAATSRKPSTRRRRKQ
jgi:hypothetical protein